MKKEDYPKYNKILIPICLGLFIILGLIVLITPADHNNVPESAPVKEQSINSAGNFKVPDSFSELIKGNDVARYADSLGQTITITKVNKGTDYVDEWFTNMSDSTQEVVVKPVTETDITNLYSVDVISGLDWIRGYVELVEVNGDKYVIQANEYKNLYKNKRYEYEVLVLVEDITDINEKNKLTPIKVI